MLWGGYAGSQFKHSPSGQRPVRLCTGQLRPAPGVQRLMPSLTAGLLAGERDSKEGWEKEGKRRQRLLIRRPCVPSFTLIPSGSLACLQALSLGGAEGRTCSARLRCLDWWTFPGLTETPLLS